jgi:hypothetical protein
MAFLKKTHFLVAFLILSLLVHETTAYSCSFLGGREISIDASNTRAYGKAAIRGSTVFISEGEGEGGIYFNSAIFTGPKWEINLVVFMTSGNAEDWAFDGFTIALTSSYGYIVSGGYGGSICYWDMTHAIVAEADFWYNPEYNDISSNSVSIHQCVESFYDQCRPNENNKSSQRDIWFVSFIILN